MTRRLKIAIYNGELPAPVFINRLIGGLADFGHTVYLFGYQRKKTSYKNKKIQVVTYTKGLFKYLFYLKYLILLQLTKPSEKKKLDKIICGFSKKSYYLKVKYYPVLYHKPDIFHLQWGKSVPDWMWVQDFGIKIVLSLRGAHINYSPYTDVRWAEIYRKEFPKIEQFHAVSRDIVSEAVKFNALPEKTKVIYSGLDLSHLPYEKKQLSTEIFNIISIGRSHWVKGYYDALEAMNLLKERSFKFRYTIIGYENDEELLFLRNQSKQNDEVVFIGQIPFNEVVKKIRETDLLLLPSVKEGIANVVLEAMALGTPVLSTDCGGMREVVKEGETGWLVPVRNPLLMSEKILEISTLPHEKILEITSNARKIIEQNHNSQQMIENMNQLYASCYDR